MTKAKKWLLALGLLLIGGLAGAAAEQRVDRYGGQFPVWFNKGLYVGLDARNPTKATTNKVTGIYSGTPLVYDFPSIPALGAGSGCQDSPAGVAIGCRFGDTIELGIDQIPPANLNAQLPTAYVSAADAFKVRVCNGSSDGGAIDWPDASYTPTCISHQ